MKNPVFLVLLTSVFASPPLLAQAAPPPPAAQAQPAPPAADQNAAQPAGDAGAAVANGGQKFITEESGQQMLSSNLVGMSVTNSNNDDIGKIDNLLLNKDGNLTGVVVSIGGFLGIGSKHVALPMSEVQINPGQKKAMVSLSKDDLKNAPDFKTKEEQQKEEQQAAQKAKAQQRGSAGGMPAPAAPAGGAPSGAAPATPGGK
ncbi:MAG TPA: PRC-barrel domain-containing protein [Burkholderiales bacterium]|nr:PRC-barrel domain-containing protein [Burkholderiales bacterium]